MTDTQAPQQTQQSTMLDKAILLQIELRSLGNSRKVSSEVVAADADKDQLHVSKKLLDCPELKAIGNLDEAMKAFVKSKCLPSVLKKGVFLLPIVSIEAVNGRLGEFAAQREGTVEAFLDVYEAAKEQANARLRALYDPDDYPSVGRVKEHFSLSWNYLTFGVPEALAKIDQALFESEKAKAAAQWHEAQGVVQDLMRVRMMGLVEHLTERLSSGSDGKAKTFKKSLISNIGEFLQEFDALNVTSDGQLAELVAKARGLLDGVDADTLRKSKELREALKSGFCQIEGQLSDLIVDKPKRGISFEDE